MFGNPTRSRRPAAVADVTPREALELTKTGKAVIVDVRERDEWENVRIPGAIHIPLGEVDARAQEIPRDRAVITQCRSGFRSALAAQALAAAGFREVLNLDGGIDDWIAASMAVERGA